MRRTNEQGRRDRLSFERRLTATSGRA